MKKQATNQFIDGLVTDFHPLTAKNTTLTSALNATLVTTKGNEMVLQNDVGNLKAGETINNTFIEAQLKEDYIPIGIKEYGGIIYIASYNPKTNYGEIGSYPSPEYNDYTYIPSPELDLKYIINTENIPEKQGKLQNIYKPLQNLKAYFDEIEIIQHDASHDVDTILDEIWHQFDGRAHDYDIPNTCSIRIDQIGETYNISVATDPTFTSQYKTLKVVGYNDQVFFKEIDLQAQDNSISISRALTAPKQIIINDTIIQNVDYPYLQLQNVQLNTLSVDNNQYSVGSETFDTFSDAFIRVNELAYNKHLSVITEFNTELLNFDLEHPVTIEVQESYDGSVNLILTDNKNIPRLINTGFSVIENNQYIIPERYKNSENYYQEDGEEFELKTSLIKRTKNFPKVIYDGVLNHGNLAVGNYTLYFKYMDEDGNETDFIAESGIISIFKGKDCDPFSIDGGVEDMNANKSIKITLSNLDSAYHYIKVYYVRTSAAIDSTRIPIAAEITKKYSIDSGTCDILITGDESVNSIPVSEINTEYIVANTAKTEAQCANMLFLGNIETQNFNHTQLTYLSQYIIPYGYRERVVERIGEVSLKDYGSITSKNGYTLKDGGFPMQYYNTKNIYYNVGYWNEEYYRLGIVYVFNDNTKSPVYNILGYEFNWDNDRNENENEEPFKKESNKITITPTILNLEDCSVTPPNLGNTHVAQSNIYGIIQFNDVNPKEDYIYSIRIQVPENFEEVLKKFNICGYFFVRQKRIPTIACQGYTLPWDKEANIPILTYFGKRIGNGDIGDPPTQSYWNCSSLSDYDTIFGDKKRYVVESFMEQSGEEAENLDIAEHSGFKEATIRSSSVDYETTGEAHMRKISHEYPLRLHYIMDWAIDTPMIAEENQLNVLPTNYFYSRIINQISFPYGFFNLDSNITNTQQIQDWITSLYYIEVDAGNPSPSPDLNASPAESALDAAHRTGNYNLWFIFLNQQSMPWTVAGVENLNNVSDQDILNRDVLYDLEISVQGTALQDSITDTTFENCMSFCYTTVTDTWGYQLEQANINLEWTLTMKYNNQYTSLDPNYTSPQVASYQGVEHLVGNDYNNWLHSQETKIDVNTIDPYNTGYLKSLFNGKGVTAPINTQIIKRPGNAFYFTQNGKADNLIFCYFLNRLFSELRTKNEILTSNVLHYYSLYKYCNHRQLTAICPEFEVRQPYFNSLFTGSQFNVKYLNKEIQQGYLISSKERYYYSSDQCAPNTKDENNNYLYGTIPSTLQQKFKIISVTDNVPVVAIDNTIFKSVIGSDMEAYRFAYINEEHCTYRYKNENHHNNSCENGKGNNTKKTSANANDFNLVRGIFSPYLGIVAEEEQFNALARMYTEGRRPIYNQCLTFNIYYNNQAADQILIRQQDNSSYRSICDVVGINDDINDIQLFRGDCFICNFTHRLNRNFNDPTAPTNDKILDSYTWKYNYDPDTKATEKKTEGIEKLNQINRGDINAVKLGSWITIRIRSSYNLSIRSLDESHIQESGIMGRARGFYPLQQASPDGGFKIPNSYVINDGFGATLGEKWYETLVDAPYINTKYNTRVIYSDIDVSSIYKNGYRIFRGGNYKDYTKQYGEIVKIIEKANDLICVFEHGVALLKINEKAVAAQSDGGLSYITANTVLPETPFIYTDMYGSQWPESVIKTPTGLIYGVDAVRKKLWKLGERFEIISDFRIEKFLQDNLVLGEKDVLPYLGLKHISTHYNANKSDVMFTFYYKPYNINEVTDECGKVISRTLDTFDNREIAWNVCYNEILDKFQTFYSWIPIASANIDNQFYSFDRECSREIVTNNQEQTQAEEIPDTDDRTSVVKHIPEHTPYLWKHGQVEKDSPLPTHWYDEQHPFEFEFIVNEEVGVQKIFNNLIIISNKAEPESFHFTVNGDGYEFDSDKLNMYYRQEKTRELFRTLKSHVNFDEDVEKLYGKLNQNIKSTILPLYYNKIHIDNDIYDYYTMMLDSTNSRDYSELSGSEILWDKTLNEFLVSTHIKNQPVTDFTYLRGNSWYKEDRWNVQIPSITLMQKNEEPWQDVPPIVVNPTVLAGDIKDFIIINSNLPNTYTMGDIDTTKWTFRKEAKIRDKYCRIKIRYDGTKLAVISAIITTFTISYA